MIAFHDRVQLDEYVRKVLVRVIEDHAEAGKTSLDKALIEAHVPPAMALLVRQLVAADREVLLAAVNILPLPQVDV